MRERERGRRGRLIVAKQSTCLLLTEFSVHGRESSGVCVCLLVFIDEIDSWMCVCVHAKGIEIVF